MASAALKNPSLGRVQFSKDWLHTGDHCRDYGPEELRLRPADENWRTQRFTFRKLRICELGQA